MSAILWQRVEGAGLALAGLLIAAQAAPGWGWLIWLAVLFAPDLSMVGYLAGPRAGAVLYNLGHLYALAFLMMVLGVALGSTGLIAGGGLWLAHIGLDRALGYGLKEPLGFRNTHLGQIGRKVE
ncbi:DUF4260 family protein [Paracoccus kondratievae]|uniref:DUF4260 family protein n=1 Tax=Paracoccus kondratievae TaxID=135740 RepID=A0AAD3NU57_9RHOB|nr:MULTISPECIES: DUF4260 domain-containing protein [Paracoccus]QFQ86403.1 DUF4260 family protein [Paracoccus kondratievae]GLK62545.1 hypothetical protein GCM10017635_00130 [Paracoccus kondratievae]SMG10934.1 protein of unknown function [Paracoccus sp. J56]